MKTYLETISIKIFYFTISGSGSDDSISGSGFKSSWSGIIGLRELISLLHAGDCCETIWDELVCLTLDLLLTLNIVSSLTYCFFLDKFLHSFRLCHLTGLSSNNRMLVTIHGSNFHSYFVIINVVFFATIYWISWTLGFWFKISMIRIFFYSTIMIAPLRVYTIAIDPR